MEIWKDVVGYEKQYEVSNYGRIRTYKGRKTWSKRYNKWKHWKHQRIMKPKISKNDSYQRISLYKDNEPKSWLVHRIVALAFIEKEYKEQDNINHIDGDPSNNCVNNLEWCTPKENIEHALITGLIDRNYKVIITDKNQNQTYFLLSIRRADQWLQRGNGYIYHRLKAGFNDVKDIKGNIYHIKVFGSALDGSSY